MSRTSTKKTTAAVLRSIIGIKDSEMADILGCRPPTIHSLESGRLQLSEKLAQRIFHETGASLTWLLNGDTSAPPISGRSEPYTKEIFDRVRAQKNYPRHPVLFSADFLEFAGRLRSILEGANRRKAYQLPAYKIGKFLDALANEFGENKSESQNVRGCVAAIKRDIAKWKRFRKKVLPKLPTSKRSSPRRANATTRRKKRSSLPRPRKA
jgi:transcriptional regulator with XRE-family HTH domain